VSKKRASRLADPVAKYARDVVDGKITMGRLVRMACERHLRDLEDGHKRGLWFDVNEAIATIDFWQMCPHLKGEKARLKENLVLESWQKFIIGSIYGWKKEDGRRRFKVAWIEMGRKNGKSTLLYPAGIHGLTVDGEEGAEVYSVATKKDQAKLVYGLARRAIKRVPEFAEVLTTYAHSVICEDNFGKFEALGADADTLDGLNPSVTLADEIHKWKGRLVWDVIETGMGARRQPLLLAITTAGEEGASDVYGQEHEYTEQVLSGLIHDDTRFGYIACVDEGDNLDDEKVYIKANPNIGVSLEVQELRDAWNKAKHSPAAANAVKRLRFGIRSQDADAWIPVQSWDSCGVGEIDWSVFRKAACGAGLDTSSSTDFSSLSLCFPVGEDLLPAEQFESPWGYLFRLWFWMPEGWQNPIEKRLREIASPWLGEWIEKTSGDVIDHDCIEAKMKEVASEFDVKMLCYDPQTTSKQLAIRIQEAGIEIEPFNQNMSRYANPTKRFAELVMGKRLKHEGSPVMRWMVGNTTVIINGANQMMPSRKKSKNKIDGVTASVMALDGCLSPSNTSFMGELIVV